jgi:hypothetical protein
MATRIVVVPGRPRNILRTAIPAAAGVAAAFVVAAQSGVAPVVMLCPAIYLFAAAIGRRWGSWVGFALSFVVLTPGIVLGRQWVSLVALGVIQVGLVIVGLTRRAWQVPVNRLQLLGAVAFSGIAIAAAAGAAPWAGLIAIVGLFGHGAWDLWHHRADAVVVRSYAAFCAALDIVLAVVVVVALIVGG